MIYRQSEETLSLAQILDADPDALRTLGNPAMIARWVLAIAVCYAVEFHSPESLATVLRQSFVGAVLALTLATTWALHTQHRRWLRTLAGDESSLAAQIVGICDVYNALVSERAQRPAMGSQRASAFIEQEIGRLWNPWVARSLLDAGARDGLHADVGDGMAQDHPDVQSTSG